MLSKLLNFFIRASRFQKINRFEAFCVLNPLDSFRNLSELFIDWTENEGLCHRCCGFGRTWRWCCRRFFHFSTFQFNISIANEYKCFAKRISATRRASIAKSNTVTNRFRVSVGVSIGAKIAVSTDNLANK